MHIIAFIVGNVFALGFVVFAAIDQGFGPWPTVGLGAATLVLAQVFYLAWIAVMARNAARRAKPVEAPPNPVQRIVQKG